MLVQVTKQPENDMHKAKEILTPIVDIIDLMAQYNLGLLQFQISEQLDIFKRQGYHHKKCHTTTPSP
jgi:hypothetical protein